MAGITLAEAEAHLSAAQAALTKARSSQAYSIAGRSLSRANHTEILEEIKYWNREVNRLSRGGRRASGAIPND